MKSFITLFLTFLGTIALSQSKYEWEKYDNPLMITIINANTINAFENSPESIVIYFYASKIRNDNKWIEVVLDEENRSERLKRKLITYESWTITRFQLVSKTEYDENKLWIKIFFEIEYDGQKDSGIDEVTVHLIDGKWIITSVPT